VFQLYTKQPFCGKIFVYFCLTMELLECRLPLQMVRNCTCWATTGTVWFYNYNARWRSNWNFSIASGTASATGTIIDNNDAL
jgi:hypothetical protein